jgi:alpha-amylase/alpha-mannosidase (GH57 family)
MPRYLCIHGHFYQPPRENAWLEEIETQESAAPYHDWNERITAECYGPNSVSRILDGESKIVDIVNNYSKISFNFGATLLSWLKEFTPKVYHAIQDGDKESLKRFGGHGSAMAQVYNHIIMPLANKRDKETQVIWGIRDFEDHFGRKPEGMWLAETAVDYETLEVLAAHHIKFTVLAPRQAKRFRKIGSEEWVNGIEPRQHYICKLPSGKKITLFFYDGEVSEAVAFKGLLKDGKEFARNLINRFNPNTDRPQLVHMATDGESYGHHHRHGDMALAFCLDFIEENNLAKITNYSQYMHLVEAEYEAEIHENSSWSCVHGVERWRSNCGCNAGGGNGTWHQRWRAPLREALDWLRDELAEIYEAEMNLFHPRPWELRNHFIDVILHRSKESIEDFLEKHIKATLTDLKKTQVLRLLEMQRQALLMFTSCAWFFDEISGIETVQVLQYANRAIQLGERGSGKSIEATFIEKLKPAQSNHLQYGNGTIIYHQLVAPSRLTLTKVGMHYAVASLFAEEPEKLHVLNYEALNQYFERLEAGVQRMAIGRTTVYSNITMSQKYFSFVALYLGQHHIIGGFSEHLTGKDFFQMVEEVKGHFTIGNIAEILKTLQIYFPHTAFSIWDLFKDEKIQVFNQVLAENMNQAKNYYQQIVNRNYNLLLAMQSQNLPVPTALKQNLQTVINQDLEGYFEKKTLNTQRLKNLVAEVRRWDVPLNKEKIALVASQKLYEMAREFAQNDDFELLEKIQDTLTCLWEIHVRPLLNETQEVLFKLSRKLLPTWESPEKLKEEELQNRKIFLDLCVKVNMRIV